MTPEPNHPRIEKGILSFSHDRIGSRQKADRQSIAKAQREIASGKKGVSHLILRAEDDSIDRLKFLFLIHGIPIMCYALANLLHSSLREIVVIGSDEVKRVLDRYLEINGTHGKQVHFAHEDPENLSMINTMALGKKQLPLAANELALFQPGDLPFLYDLEKVLQDEDIQHYNLILWLNARQKMFPDHKDNADSEFVQRNYHYRVILEEENQLLDVKEPNVYPINLTAVAPNIIDRLHSSRKDGQILKAGLEKALEMPIRFLRLIPILMHHLLNFRSDLKRFRKRDRYQFGMHQKNFDRGVTILLETACITKFHNDPAFVSDVDALEDWEDFQSLTQCAADRYGADALTRLHPCGEELLKFREHAMPGLQNEVPMYADFPSYINDIYRSLEMGYVPFDGDGKYIAPSLQSGRNEIACLWYARKCEAEKVRSDSS